MSAIPVFGLIDGDFDETFQRNGILRFYIGSYFIAIFCIYFYWSKLQGKLSCLKIVLFIVFMISMYLYMTRQIMLATLVTIGISICMMNKKKVKLYAVISVVILGFLLYQYYDVLFGELVNSYKQDQFTTDIRWKCMNFTTSQFLNNPSMMIFGFGHIAAEKSWASKGYYMSDIGILGETFYYGIGWAILYVYILYKYVWKYGKIIPLYIRLFFIGTFINSIFIFPYRNNSEAFIWVCALYVGGLYIRKKKICKIKRKHNEIFRYNSRL